MNPELKNQIFFNGKLTYPPLAPEGTLNLSSKAVDHTNNLEQIVQNKGQSVPPFTRYAKTQRTYRNSSLKTWWPRKTKVSTERISSYVNSKD